MTDLASAAARGAVAAAIGFVASAGLVSASSSAAIGAVAIGLAWILLSAARRSPVAPDPDAALLVALAATAATAAAAWTGRLADVAGGILQLAAIGAVVVVATAVARAAPAGGRRLLAGAAVLASACTAAVLADNAAGSPVASALSPGGGQNLYNRGLSWLAIAVFPLAAAAGRAGAATVALCLAAAASSASATAALAVVSGISAWTLVRIGDRTALRALAAVSAATVMATPGVAIMLPAVRNFVPPSWGVRTLLWDEGVRRGIDALPLGTGWEPEVPVVLIHLNGNLLNRDWHHPHNFAVQLFMEMGVPGLALGAAATFLAFAAASRLPEGLRPAAAASAAAAIAAAATGFNLWSDSMWAVWGLVVCAFGLLARDAAGVRAQPLSPGPTSSVSSYRTMSSSPR